MNEKYRNVVADNIPIPLFRIHLHGETANVANEIRGAFVSGNGREPDKRWCFLACTLKEIRARQLGQGFVVLEVAMRPEASCVHDPLRNPLMVKVEDLLAKMKIFEQRGSTRPDAERVLVIRNRSALLGR